MDVAYGFFSPYNYGKDTCVGLETENGTCRGFVKTFGNHVGDWEHVEIRFQDRRPTDIYISVHRCANLPTKDWAQNFAISLYFDVYAVLEPATPTTRVRAPSTSTTASR